MSHTTDVTHTNLTHPGTRRRSTHIHTHTHNPYTHTHTNLAAVLDPHTHTYGIHIHTHTHICTPVHTYAYTYTQSCLSLAGWPPVTSVMSVPSIDCSLRKRTRCYHGYMLLAAVRSRHPFFPGYLQQDHLQSLPTGA